MPNPLHNLSHNKTRMVLFGLLVLGSTLLATAFLPRIYRVTAQVQIFLPVPKYTFDPQTLSRRPFPVPSPKARRLWLYHRLDHLKDPAFLQEVLSSQDLPPKEARTYLKNLQVQLLQDTSQVTLTLETRHPKSGARFLQALLQRFQKDLRASLPSAQKAQALKQAARAADAALAKAQTALKDLKNQTHLTLLQARLPNLQREIGSFQDDLDQKKARLAALTQEIQDLQKVLPRLPKMIPARAARQGPPPGQDPLTRRLQALQKKEQELLAKYPKGSPSLEDLKKEIQALTKALLKRDLAREQKVLNPARVRLQQQLAGKKSAREALLAQIQVLKKRIQNRAAQAARLQQQLRAANLQAATLQAQIQEARKKDYALADLSSQADLQEKALALQPVLKILEAPLPPVTPVKPDPKQNLLYGLALALLGALALGLLLPPKTP